MKIVIDIPDWVYKHIVQGNEEAPDENISIGAIRNGTSLPKGHGRLIDADELKKIIKEHDILTMAGFSVRLCDIDNTPTIIEADKE